MQKTDILEKIDGLFKEAQRYRQQFEEKWREEQRFYSGDQWKYATKRPVKNWCFTIVEGELPILTDSRPASDVIPRQQEQMDDAKVLSSAIEYNYEQQNLSIKVSEAMRNALKAGPCGYHYVDFDPDSEGGEGSISIKTVPWDQVYLDPTANLIEDANYAILEFPIRKDELIRRFPSKKKQIEESNSEFRPTNTIDSFVDPSRWDGIGGYDDSTHEKSRYDSEHTAIIRESWLKDYSLVNIPEEMTIGEIAKEADEIMRGFNPDIGKWEDHEQHMEAHEELGKEIVSQFLGIPPEMVEEEAIEEAKQDESLAVILGVLADHMENHKFMSEENPGGKMPKYDKNWRLVISCGDTILYDGEAPVSDGMIPLVLYYCYKTGDSIYGMSEIRNIIDAQKSYNEMDYSEYKGLKLCSNPGWVKTERSGVDSDTLTNEEGLVVTIKGDDINGCRRLEPGHVSPQLAQRKGDDTGAIERISGINEASQGRRPTGITAASAIKFLQEQSVGRIRLKTRYLEEYSLLRLGKLVASRIVRYWTTERMLRLYDKNGQIKFINFNPDSIQKLNYEIRTVPGSTAGMDKESIFSVMSDLTLKGIIPAKTMIETTDLPMRTKILEDLAAIDEKDAMLEQLAAENEQLKALINGVDQTPQQ